MNTVAFSGDSRSETGTKAAKILRRQGLIPCVIYGGKEVVHFTTTVKDVKGLIYTPDFLVANVTVDGNVHRCIIKDVQFHPVTDDIVHIDFIELVDGKPVKAELPISFTGVSPGVRNGGVLQQYLRRVKVKVTPENLVDHLEVDISGLTMGLSVRVRDLASEVEMEILSPGATPIATVEVPRALRSEEELLEEEEGEGLEGEATEEGATEEGGED